jgi:hypothetical protein
LIADLLAPLPPAVLQDYFACKLLLGDVALFSQHASGIRLRSYQLDVAESIVRSVTANQGLTFVVLFPRQSGKNELQALIEIYLMTVMQHCDADIVKVSPTYKPQTLNAMRRLERRLARNVVTSLVPWTKEAGHVYRMGRARTIFLSGAPTANVVGATASTLLECDEAQDVLPSKWDKDFAPMAASTNATRVFWGTAWTAQTLLARELRLARLAEARDGIRRLFIVAADAVSREVPAYAKFVREQVARLGRQHPLVKTQFFCEELDGLSGMFPPRRLALLAGSHPRLRAPRPARLYALLLDVAGEDEALDGALPASAAPSGAGLLANPRRDSTALTVLEVDLSGLSDPLLRLPAYRIVDRQSWIGVRHAALYPELRALAQHWQARYLVVDATGVGAGLASFLDRSLPGRVVPFVFNSNSKSKLGWDLLSLVETGRLKDYAVPEEADGEEREHEEFIEQLQACQMEIVPGPERRMKWGVPDGTRSPLTGEYIHDDWILSAALAAVLDLQPWAATGPALVVHRADPLAEMDREGF